jgi:hypothetical protein
MGNEKWGWHNIYSKEWRQVIDDPFLKSESKSSSGIIRVISIDGGASLSESELLVNAFVLPIPFTFAGHMYQPKTIKKPKIILIQHNVNPIKTNNM